MLLRDLLRRIMSLTPNQFSYTHRFFFSAMHVFKSTVSFSVLELGDGFQLKYMILATLGVGIHRYLAVSFEISNFSSLSHTEMSVSKLASVAPSYTGPSTRDEVQPILLSGQRILDPTDK